MTEAVALRAGKITGILLSPFLAFGLILLLLPIEVPTIMGLWNTFVIPLTGWKQLGIWSAVGLMAVRAYFMPGSISDGSKDKDLWITAAGIVNRYALAWIAIILYRTFAV